MLGLKRITGFKRCYSSSISQDFLKNVLERVKETTSRKAAPPMRNNRNMKAKDGRKPRQNGPRKNNYKGRSENQIVQRTKPTINVNIINRQPQFQKRHGANAAVAAESADNLIDALDTNNVTSSKRQKKLPRKTQRSVPALAQNPTTTEDIIAQAKRTVVSQQYIPTEPTPLSLVKYTPRIANTFGARFKSYGLSTLDQSNFPLYRPVNLGVASFPDQSPANTSLTPRSQYFGQYTPYTGLVWQREKFLKNIVPKSNIEEFSTFVKGERIPLQKLTKDDFMKLAKTDKKRQELVWNSETVRLSVERSGLDNASKQLVFEVCSGLKPVAELKN